MNPFVIALILMVVLVAILGAVGVLVANAYSKLKTDFRTFKAYPEVKVRFGAVARALFDVFRGDYLAAATSTVTGVVVEGQMTFHNDSFLPLYLPSVDHSVRLEGQPTPSPVKTNGFWLSPKNTQSRPVRIMMEKGSLAIIALEAVTNGGVLKIDVDSSLAIAGFTIHKLTSHQAKVTRSLSRSPGDTAPPSNVTEYAFTPAGIPLGGSATARVVVTGGASGSYTIRLIRDVPFGTDEFVADYSFTHISGSTTKQTAFNPTSVGSYHMEVHCDGFKIWSQPKGSPRLKVT